MEIALLLDIINEEEEYKVEEVWKQECSTQFLVYQKRYGNEHNQCITETGLLHTRESIQDYWTKILR